MCRSADEWSVGECSREEEKLGDEAVFEMEESFCWSSR